MVPATILPGGSCHTGRESTKGIYEEAVLVSGRHLFARVKVAFGNTLDQGVEGIAVHLERGRCRNEQKQQDIRYTAPRNDSTLALDGQSHLRSIRKRHICRTHAWYGVVPLCVVVRVGNEAMRVNELSVQTLTLYRRSLHYARYF